MVVPLSFRVGGGAGIRGGVFLVDASMQALPGGKIQSRKRPQKGLLIRGPGLGPGFVAPDLPAWAGGAAGEQFELGEVGVGAFDQAVGAVGFLRVAAPLGLDDGVG